MSPRSIDMKNGIGDSSHSNSNPQQQQRSRRDRQGSGDFSPHAASDSGHKRNGRSSDHPTQIQFGSHGSMVVPSSIVGPPPRGPSLNGMNMNMNFVPPGFQPPGPPRHQQPPPRHRRTGSDGHRRAESWTGNVLPPPMCPPSPGFPPGGMPPPPGAVAGNPMMPFMVDPNNFAQGETNPLLGEPQTHRKRKSGTGGGHRRSASSGAAYPGAYLNQMEASHASYASYNPYNTYGSYQDLPPPPAPGQKERFSPRTEFMKVAASYRNTPPSPSGRKMSPYAVNASPQGTPRSGGKVGFSPHPSSASPRNSIYGSINGAAGSNMTMPDFPTSATGEAVFMAQKHSHRPSHRGESSRKRHMRQKSAQLFMEEVKGNEQPLACRDVVFLLLFLFHIVGIVFLGTTYGPEALIHEEGNLGGSEEVQLYYKRLLYVAGLSGAFAVAFSMLALGIMTLLARKFVQVALFLAVSISFCWGTIGIGLSPRNLVPITGFVAFALTVAYTFIVWDRIPFCSANLLTALSGLKANKGIVVVALAFQALSLAYSVYYTFVVVGVYDAIQEGKLNLSRNMEIFVYTMLGVSFYWTHHVILNLLHVTTAKVIAGWWYDPDEADVFAAFSTSAFYSMGSVCFGSLLVGPVRMIRQLSALVRPSADHDSALLCVHECLNCIQTCITNCVDGLANHFNPWAFTYIGIYNYGFLDAGSNATELFRTRGWSMIVTDDLVPNLLLMTSLVVGGATGLFAHLIENFEGLQISSLGQPGPVSFGTGVVLGLVITSVLFGIISSSLNAVLVCFAASPVDFETNHPELSHEMRAAWREVWPGCMDVVDLRVALANPSPHHSSRGSGIPAEFL